MKKGQVKYIERIKKNEWATKEMTDLLGRNDLTLRQTETVFNYICRNVDRYTKEDVLREAEKYAKADEVYLAYGNKDDILGKSEIKDWMYETKKQLAACIANVYLARYIEEKLMMTLFSSVEDPELEKIKQFCLDFAKMKKQMSINDISDIRAKRTRSMYFMLWEDGKLTEENIDKIDLAVYQCNYYKIPDETVELYYEHIMREGWENLDIRKYLMKEKVYNCITQFVDNIKEYARKASYKYERCVSLKQICETIAVFVNDEDAKTIDKVQEILKNRKAQLEIHGERIMIFENDEYINIAVSIGNGIILKEDEKIEIPEKYSVSFTVFPDGSIMERQNGKTYPLSIKKLYKIGETGKKISEIFLNTLMGNGMYFASDIKKDIEEYEDITAPVTLNDVMKYHSRREWLAKYGAEKYKVVNWNKANISKSYLVLKSMTYVEDKTVLLSYVYDKEVCPRVYGGRVKNKVMQFLSEIIVSRLKTEIEKQTRKSLSQISEVHEDEIQEEIRDKISEYQITARDMVSMRLQKKEKIKVSINSLAELENLHEDANRVDYDKETGRVRIPKDSRFNKLQKLLPDDFEWIKTRKRLITETKLQHHCVWQYADKITEDNCAIYSYYDAEAKYGSDPKRYTIEFMISSGKYYVKQVQGRYDRKNASVLHDYLQSYLNEKQK